MTTHSNTHPASPAHGRSTTTSEVSDGRGNALDIVETAFRLLVAGPSPLTLDGAAIGHGLPPRSVGLDEVKDLLLARTAVDELKDAVWAELVCRARQDGPTGSAWTIGCFGLALPALKRITARATRDLPASQAEDTVAELVAAFLAALKTVDIDRHSIALRLMWAARRAATRTRYRNTLETPLDPDSITPAMAQTALPPATAGMFPGDAEEIDGPGQVLTEAVLQGVITQNQADLILITRLHKTRVTDLATRLGIPPHRLYDRRERAEARLTAAIRTGRLSANSSQTPPARP